ncbi:MULTISPECIES: FAD-dependent monooxygenase [unclassified Kribbella]|uniref:FAD-dependent monooxygenase n=1 Tax=unclassified Kribbella TaxID=2644121 RepID=UPI003016B4B5
MSERNAVIVGAGIGGLAAAIALHRRGWNTTVFERAPALREVGAGISLWPNAVGALDLLGVGDQAREYGAVEGAGGFRDSRGRWLFRSQMRTHYGDTLVLRRSVLLDILSSALPADLIKLNTEADHLHAADVLVGADGLRSTVRAALWPDAAPPVYAGYTTWRLIAPAPELDAEVSESWGRGERVGIFRLADGAIYCYFTARTPPGIEYADDLSELKRRFGHWHDPIPAVLDSLTGAEILRHDIYRLPPLPSYVADRVALLGDAAHAMTPDLGQGGGTALEDAVELAEALESTPDISLGLTRYDQRRRRRTQQIARQSARFGAFAQASGRLAVPLRNTAARLLPQSVFLRSVQPMLDWHPCPLHADEDRDTRENRQQPGQSR